MLPWPWVLRSCSGWPVHKGRSATLAADESQASQGLDHAVAARPEPGQPSAALEYGFGRLAGWAGFRAYGILVVALFGFLSFQAGIGSSNWTNPI